jgi:hypothetical protein
MCRRNQLVGVGILTFGLGMLTCCWLESEIVRNCCGIALAAIGLLLTQKKEWHKLVSKVIGCNSKWDKERYVWSCNLRK